MARAKRRETLPEHDTTRINFDPESETLDRDYMAFHKHAKKMPESKRRAIEAKFQAAFDKRREGLRRWANTHFLFWRVCGDKACRRTSRCAGGEPEACFDRWWPVVPERDKVYFRACITQMKEGMTAEELGRAARAEVERAAEHIARIEAEQARAREARQAVEKDTAEVSHPTAQALSVQPPTRRFAGGGKEERSGPRVRVL